MQLLSNMEQDQAQDQAKEHLKDILKKKESEKEHFQSALNHYGYALISIKKEIEKINAILKDTDRNTKWKWYQRGEWDTNIAEIIRHADQPLTKDDIIAQLMITDQIADTIVDKQKYLEQKIIHALKRECITSHKISGVRKMFYCLPEWYDAEGNILEEILVKMLPPKSKN